MYTKESGKGIPILLCACLVFGGKVQTINQSAKRLNHQKGQTVDSFNTKIQSKLHKEKSKKNRYPLSYILPALLFLGLPFCLSKTFCGRINIKELRRKWIEHVNGGTDELNLKSDFQIYLKNLKNENAILKNALINDTSKNSELAALKTEWLDDNKYKVFSSCAEIRFNGDNFDCYHGENKLNLIMNAW